VPDPLSRFPQMMQKSLHHQIVWDYQKTVCLHLHAWKYQADFDARATVCELLNLPCACGNIPRDRLRDNSREPP
jgi:hypothetical protein